MSTPPCVDVELERRYLAGCMYDPALLSSEPLAPSVLWSPAHQHLLAAQRGIVARGEELNTTTLRVELDRAGRLREVGDDLLLSLTSYFETSGATVARRLRELAQARQVRDAAMRAAAAAERGSVGDAVAILREAEETGRGEEIVPTGTIYDAGIAWLREVVEAEEREAKGAAVPRVGMALLDTAIRAYPGGTMHVIAGRSGCRKSWLMLSAAVKMARRGLRPGIVSLEDRDAVWGERAAMLEAQRAGVDAMREVESLRRLGIELTYPIAASAEVALEATHRMLVDRRVDALLVDYLQAIAIPTEASRYEAVTNFGRRLKALAAKHGKPLWVGSQVTTPKGREYKEPAQNELRESGNIFIEAESLIFLWKESPQENAPVHGRVAKVKWGAAGQRFRLVINPRTGALEDAEKCGETEDRESGQRKARYEREEFRD